MNSMTLAEKRFRGFQLYMDSLRLHELLIPEGYDESLFSGSPVDYFRRYGFKVARKYSEIYYRYNGIASEKYIPASLYYYTIYPFLCNLNMSMAYADKNVYDLIFHSFRRPTSYLHSVNNRYYLPISRNEISKEDAIELLLSKEAFIIKPAIESGGGRDVRLVKVKKTDSSIIDLLNAYGTNFVVQEALTSHPDMLKLNKTSLNTIRVYTLRVPDAREYVVLGATVRFGGAGAFRDNACVGGGFSKVNPDGRVEDTIFRYRSFEKSSLREDKKLDNFFIPAFDRVQTMCVNMHKVVPFMDLIGWDIAIDEQEEPVLIELNQTPDCELLQITNGPMFGVYSDTIMEKVKGAMLEEKVVYSRTYCHGPQQYDYNFDISRRLSI